MNAPKATIRLSVLIAVLAFLASGVGLFWHGGGASFPFESLRGETVEVYGQGLYRYDSLFVGAGNRGTDAVTLFLGIPLLIASVIHYRRGSLRGKLLLLGIVVYFLYVYASYALGAVAYNELFLVYVTLFASSLYAFVLTFASVDVDRLGHRFSSRMPRRGPAYFMAASGAVTLVVWGAPILAALTEGRPPEKLDMYTTKVTEALDLAIITPATFLACVLILRSAPLGYLVALSLLVLEALLAPLIVAQTVSQLAAGVSFSLVQIIGPITGFSVLGIVSVWILWAILRNVNEDLQEISEVPGR